MPKKNLVIVEDDYNYQEELKNQIHSIDAVSLINSFVNIEDTVEYVNKNKNIDLFLIDIGLPGIDGITGISELKKILPHSKCIIISVYDDKETILEVLSNGACGYLHKCELEYRLPIAIKEVISGGLYFTPEVSQTIIETIKSKPLSKSNLTKREKDVLKGLAMGLAKKQIADKLSIAYGTVDTHVKNIYKKLHVKCGVQAVMKAVEEGLV